MKTKQPQPRATLKGFLLGIIGLGYFGWEGRHVILWGTLIIYYFAS